MKARELKSIIESLSEDDLNLEVKFFNYENEESSVVQDAVIVLEPRGEKSLGLYDSPEKSRSVSLMEDVWERRFVLKEEFESNKALAEANYKLSFLVQVSNPPDLGQYDADVLKLKLKHLKEDRKLIDEMIEASKRW